MAIISRGVKKSYVNEVNNEGVATQKELDDHTIEKLHITNPNDPQLYGKFLKYGEAGLELDDVDSPILGWKDNVIPLTAGGEGTPEEAPLYANTGNGIWGLYFNDNNKTTAYADFHINHDYKPNTLIYPHVHWMPMSHSLGNVKWVIEYVIAKGHAQNESLTTVTQSIVVNGVGKGLIGEHIVTECTELQAFSVAEADTIVRVKVYRDAVDVSDTFYGSVVGIMIDFHYQSDFETTINKSPDFYI